MILVKHVVQIGSWVDEHAIRIINIARRIMDMALGHLCQRDFDIALRGEEVDKL
jgi:hypothetical protein